MEEYIPDFSNLLQRLELKAYPAPKRPQNRNQYDAGIMAIYRHIPLRQEVAKVSQDLPPTHQARPRKRLANGKPQIRVDLVSCFTERVKTGKRRSGYPHIACGKLSAGVRKFSRDTSGNAMVIARREVIAKFSSRRIHFSLRRESSGPRIDGCKFEVG